MRLRASSSVPGDLVQRVRALEHPEALLSVPPVANTSLLQRGEVGQLPLERLNCEGLVVMVDVEGRHDRLSFDPDCAAAGLDHQCDVLAERLQSGEPRGFEDSCRDEIALAIEDVAFVEGRLSIRTGWIRDVAECSPARKECRLPAMAPEAGQPPDPPTTDAEAAASEGEPLRSDSHRARGAKELLVARAPP